MLRTIIIALALLITGYSFAQSNRKFAEDIRKTHRIPELAYAVVSADSVYEMEVLGARKINTQLKASLNDRFRIGSNTKAITGLLAALLVKEGKISWDTKFFDLFPEMKKTSRKEYHNYTLLDLLSFRTKLIRYTYTDPVPAKGQFSGDAAKQRYQFAQWILQQPPVATTNEVSFSNPGYTAAGLMLEKASGKSYKQLVNELGQKLDIHFDFGQPNAKDPKQTWGHNAQLVPEAPAENYKLEWLLPAGNINLTMPDYVKFIQLQLKGLEGKSDLLTKQEFEFLHYGRPQFAVGWFWEKDEKYGFVSTSTGNPGTFLAKVYVLKDHNKACIILANAQTDITDAGMNIVYEKLREGYID